MSAAHGARSLTAVAAPVVLAVGAFGTVYGATATELAAPHLVIASSALLFAGASQFAATAVLAAGAGAAAALATVLLVNLRLVLLGAVMRPRLPEGRLRRAAMALVLIDEAVGLALTSGHHARRTLVAVGVACYVTWVGGTAIGALAGQAVAHEALADAVFPVLFIGLAAATATERAQLVRAAVAAPLAGALALLGGPAAGLAPVAAALAVAAAPGGRR